MYDHELTSAVYAHIKEAETYDMIAEILKALYYKNNIVYALLLLESSCQASGESISKFLHVLKGLAKDCAFFDVTANMRLEELTREAFINGLASSAISQCLLEKEELSLNQALELADNFTRAHRYFSCMGSLVSAQSLSMMTSDTNAKNSGAAAPTRQSSSPVVKAASCFCGLYQGSANIGSRPKFGLRDLPLWVT